MCMELDKYELQEIIIALRERLHSLQGEAERNGRFDYELPKVKELLDKHIAEYNRRGYVMVFAIKGNVKEIQLQLKIINKLIRSK